MSNKRINLTKDGLRKAIREHEEKYHEPTIEDVETILSCLEGIGLIAELKRCYEEIDGLLETIGSWGYVMCPRSTEWFEWDYGCQSEICASHDEDCRELVEASE